MEDCGTTTTADFDTDIFAKSSWEHRLIHLQFHRPLLAIVRQVDYCIDNASLHDILGELTCTLWCTHSFNRTVFRACQRYWLSLKNLGTVRSQTPAVARLAFVLVVSALSGLNKLSPIVAFCLVKRKTKPKNKIFALAKSQLVTTCDKNIRA